MEREPCLIEINDLHVHFERSGKWPWSRPRPVRAIDGVDLCIRRGEIVGLVGESGSGKTTLGRAMLGLAPPAAGAVLFDGEPVGSFRPGELRRRAQMIFQEPHASLSPRFTVGDLLTEPYRIHRVPEDDRRSAQELLEMVQLGPEHVTKHPHQLSGGQARRVGIARALALNPELIVADEPTAGLDVSAGAEVLNLMAALRDELGLAFLLITHDLNVVGHVADTIAVAYLGKLAEVGPVDEMMDRPRHPYTRALLAAVPDLDPGERGHTKPIPIGEIPSPANPPPGCRFHTRCPYADERCRTELPPLEPIGETHAVACHHWRVIDQSDETPPTHDHPNRTTPDPERNHT